MFNIDNGTITGTNQFQSFGEFNLGDGDIASFNGPAGIENVLSRVTGGDPSNIFGTLRSTIDGANLFFMNPAGVIFGPTASLEVSGSFHTTTADFLKLGEDGIFYASLGEDSVLTTVPVQAFGFLKENPAPIEIDQSTLSIPEEETFSLISGEITVKGVDVQAPAGQINLVSVGSAGKVSFSTDGEPLVETFSDLGKINMGDGATFLLEDGESTGGGTVMIRGGRFRMDGAYILNNNFREGSGGQISIVAREAISMTGGAIIETLTWGEGAGGEITLQAPKIHLDSAGIAANAEDSVLVLGTSTGDAGNITLSASEVISMTEGFISSSSFGEGDAGEITLQAPRILLDSESTIFNITDNTGNAGAISIGASEMVSLSQNAFILSETLGQGDGGSILIEGKDIILSQNSEISTNTLFGSGKAGQVTLDVSQLTIKAGSKISSSSRPLSSGPAGKIKINASEGVSIFGEDSGLFTFSEGEGTGGEISLTASSLSLNDRAIISAFSSGPGEAGQIFLNAGDQFVSQNSSVTTEAAQADGGDIEIQATSLVHFVNSDLTATVKGGEGTGGNILVDSNAIIVENSQIIAKAFGGPGGNIDLLSNLFFIDPSSVISASSERNDGGTVNIRASTSVLAETIAPLPKDFVSPASLYASPCVAQQGGQLSSFVQRPRDMAPPQPEDLWASPLFLELPHVAPSQSGVSLKEPSTNLSLRFADFLNFSPHFPSTQPRPSMLLTGCRIS